MSLGRTLSALADPHRRQILDRLATGPVSVSALEVPLGISVPGVLKHVRVLEAATLADTHKRGRTRWCQLSPDALDEAAGWIEEHRRLWERIPRSLQSAHPTDKGKWNLSPRDIRLQCLIDAPIDETFHHWIDTESRRRWCAPDEEWFGEAESDLRIGGTWSVSFGPTAEEIYRVHGVYEEIDQPNRLVYSSVFRYPDGRSFETRTTVTFEAGASQTLLTFIDAGYPDEEDISVFVVGTLAVLDFFERSVGSPARRATSRDGQSPRIPPMTSGIGPLVHVGGILPGMRAGRLGCLISLVEVMSGCVTATPRDCAE